MAKKVPGYEFTSFRGLSDYEDQGFLGSFRFASGIDVRKIRDTLTCQQALMDIGITTDSASPSTSPSSSVSPSSSISRSPSASTSPSSSVSESVSPSSSISPSASTSPSASASPSASISPSASNSPSISPSDGLLSVFRDLPLFFVECSDGNTYGFGDTGYIYKIDSDNYVSVVYNARERITGAWEWPSRTTTYLYFTTRTDLHRKEIPGLSSWNDVDLPGSGQGQDWPKTNLTSEDWHTMREAGGSLIIANGSTVALVGYDESYTNEAMNPFPGSTAKTIVERNGRTIIGTTSRAEPDKGVNGSIDVEVPLAQIGTDGLLYYADMRSSVPIKRFPGGGQVNPGGVANEIDQVDIYEWEQNAQNFIDKQSVGNMGLFGVFGAESGKNGIYSYGRKFNNQRIALNLDYPMDVDEIGAVINSHNKMYVSYREGSDFGVKTVDPDNKQTGIYEPLDLHAPSKNVETPTVWTKLELEFDPLPANTSIQYYYRINKSGSYIPAKTADGETSYSQEGGVKAVFLVTNQAEIYQQRIVLNPYQNDTPEITAARIYID